MTDQVRDQYPDDERKEPVGDELPPTAEELDPAEEIEIRRSIALELEEFEGGIEG